MTGRPTLAEKGCAEGPTILVPLQLDGESLRVLREAPKGHGSAFARKAIAAFIDWLDARRDSPARVPLQVPGGESVVFQMKAPAGLVEMMRKYAGPGKPYTTLSGLARTAILRAHHNRRRSRKRAKPQKEEAGA